MPVDLQNRQRRLRVDSHALRACAEKALVAAGQPEAELSVVLVSDARIARLNRTYRGVAGPTDVLSFAQQEAPVVGAGPILLGDVVLSVETAARRVADGDAAWTLHDELVFLLVHGLLHLVGHTHDADADHAAMETERERLWRVLAADGLVSPAVRP